MSLSRVGAQTAATDGSYSHPPTESPGSVVASGGVRFPRPRAKVVKVAVGDLSSLHTAQTPVTESPPSFPVCSLSEVPDEGAWQPKLQFAAVDHHGTA